MRTVAAVQVIRDHLAQAGVARRRGVAVDRDAVQLLNGVDNGFVHAFRCRNGRVADGEVIDVLLADDGRLLFSVFKQFPDCSFTDFFCIEGNKLFNPALLKIKLTHFVSTKADELVAVHVKAFRKDLCGTDSFIFCKSDENIILTFQCKSAVNVFDCYCCDCLIVLKRCLNTVDEVA